MQSLVQLLLAGVVVVVLLFTFTQGIGPGTKLFRSASPIQDLQPAWGWYVDPVKGTTEGKTIIWFVSNRAGLTNNIPTELYTVPPGQGMEEKLTRRTIDTFVDAYPAISPDGRFVAFASNRHGQQKTNIYLYDVVKGTTTRLTYRPQGLDTQPARVPIQDKQGRYTDLIICSDLYSTVPQLYRINIPTGTWTQLTYSQYPVSSPSVSPDGKYIAYTVDVNGNTDIYIMDLDGKNVQQVTSHPKHDEKPAWCPRIEDGYWIAFQTDRDGNWNIYMINPFTKAEKPLTQHPGDDIAPAWSPLPDGKALVFVSNRDKDKSPDYLYSLYIIPDVWGEIQPATGEPEVMRVTGKMPSM